MARKLGRPLDGEPKNVTAIVLITESQSKKLKHYCDKFEMSRSELVRKLLEDFFEKQERRK